MARAVDKWSIELDQAEGDVYAGRGLTFDQALALLSIPDDRVMDLAAVADRVRKRFGSDRIDLCSIINARSGLCPEDCKFCAQSSCYQSETPVYPMKTAGEILAGAKRAEESGAHRFCIVTSGDSLDDADFGVVLQALAKIGNETGLQRCASIGKLSRSRAALLKKAGLNRYHHNIETARGFFPEVCSTHSYEDKVETINHLKEFDIETCVGGILNLGETPRQRLEFAFELMVLDPVSVPINFLDPRPGTPLARTPAMPAVEAAKYLAVFRLIMPRALIRPAGGREQTFGSQPELPFLAGVSGLLIGDLLTTRGTAAHRDIELLRSLGFDV